MTMRTTVLILISLLLAACEPAKPVGLSGAARSNVDALDVLSPQGPADTSALVRAPEVFAASGVALWNGSRTTRGYWVAHPKADRSRRVRIVNSDTGAEIDGVLYRPEKQNSDNSVTLSSDAAASLAVRAGAPTRIAIFGLRPTGSTSASQRRTVETRAETELASHIARLDDNALVQVVSAAMRGMGYATIFEPSLSPGALTGIRAYPRPDLGYDLPSIRVTVRPASAGQMTVSELSALRTILSTSGDLGAIVSLSGFEPLVPADFADDFVHLELVDLEGLMNIWLTYYDRMSNPDQALLPLRPVYFLATRQ
ncbi:MAG: hypothetical protein AAGD13_20570 [Pseudomonadota bacterium]